MRFAPYRSNCGAATAARFLHYLFKFGLVVFRRETFGDGRQSRRLPAVFFYRAAACRTATLGNRSQRRIAAGHAPAPDTPAPPGNGTAGRPSRKKHPDTRPGTHPANRSEKHSRQHGPGKSPSVHCSAGRIRRPQGRIRTRSPLRTRKRRRTHRVLHAICTHSSRLRLKQPQRGFFIY
mgnify:CR=1 FL=1